MRSVGDNPHWEALRDAAYAARAEIERRLLDFRCSVLLPAAAVRGRVHVPASPRDLPPTDAGDGLPPVVLLRDAGPSWMEVALAAFAAQGAVIVERGGEMAHLVTVFRDARGTPTGPIARVDDARRLYPAGSVVEVDTAVGNIRLVEDPDHIPMAEDMPTADELLPQARDDDADTPKPRAVSLRPSVYHLEPRCWPMRHVDEAEERLVRWNEIIGGKLVPHPEIRPPIPLVEGREGVEHPAERAGFIDVHCSYRAELPQLDILVMTTHESRDHGAGYLIVRADEKHQERRDRRRNFYGKHYQAWSPEDMARAASQVIEILRPGYLADLELRREAELEKMIRRCQDWDGFDDGCDGNDIAQDASVLDDTPSGPGMR